MRKVTSGLLALTLIACSGGDSTQSTEPDPEPTYTISGTVVDSIADEPVRGATVRIGSRQDQTDGLGDYSISGLTSGSWTMKIEAIEYETYERQIQVSGTATENALIIREPPYLVSFSISGDFTFATAVDLQGASTMDTEAVAVYTGPGVNWVQGSTDVVQEDDLTLRYVFPQDDVIDGTQITEISVQLQDLDGHEVWFDCTPEWSCEEAS